MSEHQFSLRQRVYIEYTDAGGLVYHSNYLNFMERCRTDFMRTRGYEHKSAVNEGFIFVVHSLEMEFLRPAKMDDEILITLDITETKRSSVRMLQCVYRADSEELLCRASVRICSVSPDTLKPTAFPAELRHSLFAEQ